MNIIEDLRWRGLINQCTDEQALTQALERPLTLYCGFDPSAASLHVGSLVPLIAMERFKRAGHKVIGLIGGATGLIGDPSGKQAERDLSDVSKVKVNAAKLTRQVEGFSSTMVNNLSWTHDLSVIEFMRMVGKTASLSSMLQRDAVKLRLERNEGMSFAEFSFMLLQAFDFLVLNDRFNCVLQIGGSDQWGNICSGVDLIRRSREAKAFALTLPLLTNSQGRKFGKTEHGTIWLDPELTSPWDFFQFWLNLPDEDAPRLLKLLSLKERGEIESLLSSFAAQPARRDIQRALAVELTELVHGVDKAFSVRKASAFVFDNADVEFHHVVNALPPFPALELPSLLVDALVKLGLEESKSKARASIKGGAVTINLQKVTSIEARLADFPRMSGVWLIKRGKRAGVIA